MKNLNYILFTILSVAIGFLYYLHFSSPKITHMAEHHEEEKGGGGTNILPGKGIYYINTDSLWDKYEMVKNSQDELKIEKLKLEGQFKIKLDAFEKEYTELQKKASQGLITMEEAQKKEADLMGRQQQLLALKDELAMKLMEMEQDMNEKIQVGIYNYLKKYHSQKEINFVLGYNRGGGAVLFGNDSLEITQTIVEGLNKEYKAQQLNKEEAKSE